MKFGAAVKADSFNVIFYERCAKMDQSGGRIYVIKSFIILYNNIFGFMFGMIKFPLLRVTLK